MATSIVDHNIQKLETAAIDSGYHIYDALGPGLLDNVYETLLAERLTRAGLTVERQKPVSINFDDQSFDEGFRCDLLVEGKLLIEIISVERWTSIDSQRVTTYLRLMNLPMGLLINFGAPSFKQGVKRIANGYAT
ncbi:GxxExxY protein [Parasphingorhabdus sp.]|uniref:GxxExxY protein n=1 Tax=Parasphingorhabdus sp. TaxID=2709688 RepID=UPI003265EF0C